MWRWRSNSLTFRLTGTLIVALVLLLALTAVVQVALQERYAVRLRAHQRPRDVRDALRRPAHRDARQRPRGPARLRPHHQRARPQRPGADLQQGGRDRLLLRRPRGRHAPRPPLGGVLQVPPGRQADREAPAGRPNPVLRGRRRAGARRDPPDRERARPASTRPATPIPPSKRLLGVLDVTLLLPRIEQARRQTAVLMVGAIGAALLLVVGVMVLVVRRSVHRPIRVSDPHARRARAAVTTRPATRTARSRSSRTSATR